MSTEQAAAYVDGDEDFDATLRDSLQAVIDEHYSDGATYALVVRALLDIALAETAQEILDAPENALPLTTVLSHVAGAADALDDVEDTMFITDYSDAEETE